MTCPKCGEAQPTAAACRRCGLLAERMADFSRDQDAAAPELAVAWQALESSWDDPAAHERFVELISTLTAWPWAARRYRDVLRERPGDPRATEQLARIAKMTEAMLRASATVHPQQTTTYRRTLGMLMVLLVLLVIGIAYAFIVKGLRAGQVERDNPPQLKGRPPAHPRK
jgi:hypothetical protein